MGNEESRKKRVGLKFKKDSRDYTIMLIGRTGAGKSSLGNFLTTNNAFKAEDCMAPITMKAEINTKHLKGGKVLNVIDTPGFGDSRNIEEIRKDLAEAFYHARDGVDAFIFVISAAERVGADLIKSFEIFEKFIEHQNFYEYMIPVFTKVDERLIKANIKDTSKKGKKDIYNDNNQRSVIVEDLKNSNLDHLNSGLIQKAKNDYMCISSNNHDKGYHELITLQICHTIENIRDRMNGMVCTSKIMEKAKDIDDCEISKNPNSSDDEIKRIVLELLIYILISNMTGQEIEELFGINEKSKQEGETKQSDNDKNNENSENSNSGSSSVHNTAYKTNSGSGAQGTKEDIFMDDSNKPFPRITTTTTTRNTDISKPRAPKAMDTELKPVSSKIN